DRRGDRAHCRDAGRVARGRASLVALRGFHPAVARWFGERFREPTEPQRRAWPAIEAGRHVLIAAPTGSGKTFAAFLAALDALVRQGLDGTLRDETQVLYVSPLKALSNDVQKNLAEPLAAIRRTLEALCLPDVAIRTLVRTGDTPGGARQEMVRRPPHILVTTPESLYLILTSERAREMLRTVRTVIVDEIHAVARDKRGSHLARPLARPRDRDPRVAARGGDAGRGVGRDLRATGAVDRGAPDHARIREHAPARRAGDATAVRAAGGGSGRVASRQPVEGEAAGRGEPAQGRQAQGAGGDGVPRAGNRHRRR